MKKTTTVIGGMLLSVGLFAVAAGCVAAECGEAKSKARVELKCDDPQGQMQVLIDGKEALVYRYGEDCDVAHYYPVRSPSGKLLTVEQTDPYPHHRSFWFADTIQLAGQPKVSFYMAFYSRVSRKDPKSPLRDQIRHVRFLARDVTPAGATVKAQLVWAGDQGKKPMLDETRQMRIVPLADGEYFLDCEFQVTAAYGDVKFASDQTHYAWPYIRIHPQFAVAQTTVAKGKGPKGGDKNVAQPGTGRITNSERKINGIATCMQVARWVDYSGTVDGVTEGLAMFADPKQPAPKFFTRDYGTFGPRRPDEQSGKPFELKKGQSLGIRVGVLVHRGDVVSGKVAERYAAYRDGKL